MEPTIAFVADGVLYRLVSGRAPERLESAFANEVRARTQQIHRRHAWKSEGRGALFMSRGLLWGPPGRDPKQMQLRITALAHGTPPGELLYAMNAEGRTAICRLRTMDGVERRLLHGSERQIGDLAAAQSGGEVACSVAHADGSASLAVMTADATDLAEVTEGEVRDSAPAWAPGAERRLVYQSAGVGRDQHGRFAGLGPSAIHSIHLERGAVEELASEPRRDLLLPRLAADGSLYFISRPYAAERPSAWRLALDVLLIPFRLLQALFGYLSFFTTRYTGRPLTTAGGPKRSGADARRMLEWSNLIEAEAAADEDEARPATPRTWQLVRRHADGRTETVAESVLAYDLDAAGSLVYTTGSAIHLVRVDGTRHRLLTQASIQQVAFAG